MVASRCTAPSPAAVGRRVHAREPRAVRHGDLPQHVRRPAHRRPAGGLRGVLRGWRRLPRHRLGDRDRGRLAVPHRRARNARERAGPTSSPARSRSRIACTTPRKDLPRVLGPDGRLVQLHLQRPRRSATCWPPSSENTFEIQPWGGALDGIADGTMGADHPVTWCKDFRGGRSFYTALGNTTASFGEADFRTHLGGAIKWAAGRPTRCTATAAPPSWPTTSRPRSAGRRT